MVVNTLLILVVAFAVISALHGVIRTAQHQRVIALMALALPRTATQRLKRHYKAAENSLLELDVDDDEAARALLEGNEHEADAAVNLDYIISEGLGMSVAVANSVSGVREPLLSSQPASADTGENSQQLPKTTEMPGPGEGNDSHFRGLPSLSIQNVERHVQLTPQESRVSLSFPYDSRGSRRSPRSNTAASTRAESIVENAAKEIAIVIQEIPNPPLVDANSLETASDRSLLSAQSGHSGGHEDSERNVGYQSSIGLGSEGGLGHSNHTEDLSADEAWSEEEKVSRNGPCFDDSECGIEMGCKDDDIRTNRPGPGVPCNARMIRVAENASINGTAHRVISDGKSDGRRKSRFPRQLGLPQTGAIEIANAVQTEEQQIGRSSSSTTVQAGNENKSVFQCTSPEMINLSLRVDSERAVDTFVGIAQDSLRVHTMSQPDAEGLGIRQRRASWSHPVEHPNEQARNSKSSANPEPFLLYQERAPVFAAALENRLRCLRVWHMQKRTHVAVLTVRGRFISSPFQICCA